MARRIFSRALAVLIYVAAIPTDRVKVNKLAPPPRVPERWNTETYNWISASVTGSRLGSPSARHGGHCQAPQDPGIEEVP